MWWLINLSGLSKIEHGRKHKFSPGISQPTELRIEISRVCLDGKHSCGFSQSIFQYIPYVCVCVCVRVFVHCQIASLRNFPHFAEARAIYIACTLPFSLFPSLYLSHSLCEFQLSTESRATGRKNENRKQLFMFGGAVKNKMNEHIKKNKNTHTQRQRERGEERVCARCTHAQ